MQYRPTKLNDKKWLLQSPAAGLHLSFPVGGFFLDKFEEEHRIATVTKSDLLEMPYFGALIVDVEY